MTIFKSMVGMTVEDVLYDLDNIAMLDIIENGKSYSYVGEEDIDCVDPDILCKIAKRVMVQHERFGYRVIIDI